MGFLIAVDARRSTLAFMSGRRIVDMVKEDLKMSKVFCVVYKFVILCRSLIARLLRMPSK